MKLKYWLLSLFMGGVSAFVTALITGDFQDLILKMIGWAILYCLLLSLGEEKKVEG